MEVVGWHITHLICFDKHVCPPTHPPTHPPCLLQEMFQRVYGVRSSSNNNLWLRKKLIEAVNTRPRGGSGSGSDRTYQPRHQDREPAAYGGAAAAAAGEDTARRRRKKSAPTRASDGVQVRAGRGPFFMIDETQVNERLCPAGALPCTVKLPRACRAWGLLTPATQPTPAGGP